MLWAGAVGKECGLRHCQVFNCDIRSSDQDSDVLCHHGPEPTGYPVSFPHAGDNSLVVHPQAPIGGPRTSKKVSP